MKNSSCKEDLIDWLRLLRTHGIGEVAFYSLLEAYGDAKNALQNLQELYHQCKKNAYIPDKENILQEIKKTEEFGAQIIPVFDKRYSKTLKQIKNCPPVIIAMGNKALLHQDSIAIVGSRSATRNNCVLASKIAKDLSELGFNIISGLALGIDSASHSIIDNKLPTTAVVATGINITYPCENHYLAKKIHSEGGLVITEVPFNIKAKPQYFSRRNRIISGLSKGVIVIEAHKKSGSLITAKYAKSQEKPIFSMPGDPVRYGGSNELLDNGAIALKSTYDVIKELKYDDIHLSKKPSEKDYCIKIYQYGERKDVKSEILNHLNYDPTNIDNLLNALNKEKIPNQLALRAMLELEIEGKVMRYRGNEISLVYK